MLFFFLATHQDFMEQLHSLNSPACMFHLKKKRKKYGHDIANTHQTFLISLSSKVSEAEGVVIILIMEKHTRFLKTNKKRMCKRK